MAAIAALVTMLKTGDHVICGSNVYGGTPRLFDQIIAHYGIVFTYVDTTDVGAGPAGDPAHHPAGAY